MNYIHAWWNAEVGRFFVSLAVIGGVVTFFALLFAVVYIAAAVSKIISNTFKRRAK